MQAEAYFALLPLPYGTTPLAICMFNSLKYILQDTFENTAVRLGLSSINISMPNGPLMLRTVFWIFSLNFDLADALMSLTGDIGTTGVRLID